MNDLRLLVAYRGLSHTKAENRGQADVPQVSCHERRKTSLLSHNKNTTRSAALRASLRQSGVDFFICLPGIYASARDAHLRRHAGLLSAVPGGTDTWRGEVIGVSKNLLKVLHSRGRLSPQKTKIGSICGPPAVPPRVMEDRRA